MFINPIGVNNTVNSNVSKKTNAVSQPSFKRENYVRVFNQEYKRVFQYVDGQQLGQMFANLRDAAANIKLGRMSDGFRELMSKNGLLYSLYKLRGFHHDDSYESLVKQSEKQPVIMVRTERDEPVAAVVNNGKYYEDNIISQKMRSRNNHDVDRRHIDISFSGLEEEKAIVFGLDYEGDWYVARGPFDNPIERMHTFYDNGRIKEVIKPDGTMQRFNKDGSKWSADQYIVSNAEQHVRNFIKLFTGWKL